MYFDSRFGTLSPVERRTDLYFAPDSGTLGDTDAVTATLPNRSSAPSNHSPDRPVVPRVPPVKRRTPQVVLTLLAVLLVGNALIGERGLIAMLRADTEQSALSSVIGELRAENARLREDVRALREEPRTIEELARSELGLIHPGERLFIVSPAPDIAQITPRGSPE